MTTTTEQTTNRTFAIDKFSLSVTIGLIAGSIMAAMGILGYTAANLSMNGDGGNEVLQIVLVRLGWFMVAAAMFTPVIGFIWGTRDSFSAKRYIRWILVFSFSWFMVYGVTMLVMYSRVLVTESF